MAKKNTSAPLSAIVDHTNAIVGGIIGKKPDDAPFVGTVDPNDTQAEPVGAVLKGNPDLAAELEGLTRGEKLIRLRQRGLIGFEVQ